jgi:hypothetical protein
MYASLRRYHIEPKNMDELGDVIDHAYAQHFQVGDELGVLYGVDVVSVPTWGDAGARTYSRPAAHQF